MPITAAVSKLGSEATNWTLETDLGVDSAGCQFQNDPHPPGAFQCGVWALFAEEIWLKFLRTNATGRFSVFLRQEFLSCVQSTEATHNYFDLISIKRQEYKGVLAAYRAAHPRETYTNT